MINKVANNATNLDFPNLYPIKDIKEKLDYYRSLFGKINDLTNDEFENLKKDITIFFNIKPGHHTINPPKRLVRISNNNKILAAQGKELGLLTDISQLLAPPIEYCGFGRCNIPKQQVLYCATHPSAAYWEIRPKKGDVITLSHFELKSGAKVNSYIVSKDKTENPKFSSALHEVYFALDDFFVDAFSLEVSRDRPRDYLFSAMLSSDLLFYPIPSSNNLEAIIYPSVQKKKFGDNFAIRNELILERYNLIGVETRFILHEYDNLDPSADFDTTEQIPAAIGTNTFDYKNGKILYNDKAKGLFDLLRTAQMSKGPFIRYLPDNTVHNVSAIKTETIDLDTLPVIDRNDRVNVVYQNGSRLDNVKYKKVLTDIKNGKCRIVKY